MILKSTFLLFTLSFSFVGWTKLSILGKTEINLPRKEVKRTKPYKIIIVTDPVAASRAEEFKRYLVTKPPFSRMGEKLQIELVSMDTEKMNCKNDMPDAPRIITCNRDLIYRTQSQHNAHLSLAFTSNGSGGAGGDIPVASMDYPIQTMFHEMLHTFGLADEYDYSESEQKVYCDNPVSSPNVVYFKDTPPYEADSVARSKHADKVHWMGQIPTLQLITSGTNLGSSSLEKINAGLQPLGLFRGGSCNNSTLPGWRPYQSSIMKGYDDDTIYPIYEKAVLRNIETALGRRTPLPPAQANCVHNQPSIQSTENFGSEVLTIVRKIPNSHNHKH
jgi:hypothetical protein